MHFAPGCEGKLVYAPDEVDLHDDRSVRASVNVVNRIGVRIFARWRSVAAARVQDIGGFGYRDCVVVAVTFSLVPTECDHVFMKGLGSTDRVEVHRGCGRRAETGNQRDKSERNQLAKQTHEPKSTA